jgi:hypothetical protein
MPEVKYITSVDGLSTADPLPISVASIDLAIAYLKGARYWAERREWKFASVAIDGARQAIAEKPR